MFNGVLLYLILLIIGGLLSYYGIIHDKLLRKAGKMQMVFLYMLIFVMGLRLGLDKKVLDAIGSIGLKAAFFAISTSIFGILFVFIVDKIIIKNDKTGGSNDY